MRYLNNPAIVKMIGITVKSDTAKNPCSVRYSIGGCYDRFCPIHQITVLAVNGNRKTERKKQKGKFHVKNGLSAFERRTKIDIAYHPTSSIQHPTFHQTLL